MINLSQRQVLKIEGSDSLVFLQGLITQDLLKDEPFLYSLMLSPQGKFQYDLFIIKTDEALYLDTDRADDLFKRLSLFKLRSQVEISKTDFKVYTCFDNINSYEGFFYADPRNSEMGYRLYSQLNLDCSESLEIYDDHRLPLCIPDGMRDMTVDKSIPLEWNMDKLNAISFTKGCYMGQELTSRTKHLNLIKKRVVCIKNADFDSSTLKLIKEYSNYSLCFLRD